MTIHYLYWLHLPEHKNILKEGYVGVSKQPKRRFYRHKNTTENPHLLRAFEKYKDITHTILLHGEEDYCYEMEEKLRPNSQIGWNINKGGTKPPSMAGKKRPEHSIRMTGKNHPMWGKTHSKEIIEGIVNKKSRNYTVTNPQGKVFQIRNLTKFAHENNLDQAHLNRVAQGKRKQHKGWTCQYREVA